MSTPLVETTAIQPALTARQKTEAEFHDRWADTINFNEIDPDVTFTAPTALECQYILSQMGPLNGKHILDLGCGCGESAVFFAKQGAVVSACDISPRFIDITRQLAAHHQVEIQTTVCPAEQLPFPTEAFDYVFANGVLHHVDIPTTIQEIKRVLKPQGQGFFIEPIPYNPLINIYRKVAHEVRTPDERPLDFQDMSKIRQVFPEMQSRCFWFFALGIFVYFFLIERANPNKERYWKKILYEADRYKTLFGFLKRLDDAVLPRLPFLGLLCWNRVIQVTAP